MSLKKDHDIEIIKAVAQAWLSHSSSTKVTNEFDAHRRNFKNKPSRFKLEASTNSNTTRAVARVEINGWDFRESLLDTYEIVALSRKLETGLMLDHQPFSALSRQASTSSIGGKKESKNSLRNLFNKMSSSSRRFNVDDLPWENGS